MKKKKKPDYLKRELLLPAQKSRIRLFVGSNEGAIEEIRSIAPTLAIHRNTLSFVVASFRI